MAASRNEKGQILPGSTGNPKGRPKKQVEEDYLKAFTSVVTLTDWKAIIKKASEQARKGDKDARKWIADYLVGPPVQRLIDPVLVQNPYAGLPPDELRKNLQAMLKKAKLRL